MPYRKDPRPSREAVKDWLALIGLVLAIIVGMGLAGWADNASPNSSYRVSCPPERLHLDRLRGADYDGSAQLRCGRRILVRIENPRR